MDPKPQWPTSCASHAEWSSVWRDKNAPSLDAHCNKQGQNGHNRSQGVFQNPFSNTVSSDWCAMPSWPKLHFCATVWEQICSVLNVKRITLAASLWTNLSVLAQTCSRKPLRLVVSKQQTSQHRFHKITNDLWSQMVAPGSHWCNHIQQCVHTSANPPAGLWWTEPKLTTWPLNNCVRHKILNAVTTTRRKNLEEHDQPSKGRQNRPCQSWIDLQRRGPFRISRASHCSMQTGRRIVPDGPEWTTEQYIYLSKDRRYPYRFTTFTFFSYESKNTGNTLQDEKESKAISPPSRWTLRTLIFFP